HDRPPTRPRARHQHPTHAPTPDRYWEQIRDRLEDAVARLRGKDRQLILLRFYQGHSLAEIATVLHIHEDAARKRAARALAKLRHRLSVDDASEQALSTAILAHAVA